jgi:hypothetical protein
MKPLNMHGHANTWEEELIEVCRERDQLRAEVERLGLALEAIAEYESPEGHIAREALARPKE